MFLLTKYLVAALLDKGRKRLVSLGMATDKAAKTIGCGCLGVATSVGVNVTNVDLDRAKVVGGQNTVSPRATNVRQGKMLGVRISQCT